MAPFTHYLQVAVTASTRHVLSSAAAVCRGIPTPPLENTVEVALVVEEWEDTRTGKQASLLTACYIEQASWGSAGELTLVLRTKESWPASNLATTQTQNQGSELSLSVIHSIYDLLMHVKESTLQIQKYRISKIQDNNRIAIQKEPQWEPSVHDVDNTGGL